jgi:hypothetical protein
MGHLQVVASAHPFNGRAARHGQIFAPSHSRARHLIYDLVAI